MTDELPESEGREEPTPSSREVLVEVNPDFLEAVDADAQAPGTTPKLNLGPGAMYEVLGSLGQGGMAEVFLARRVGPAGFTRDVAIKRIKPALANAADAHFAKMFLDEARLVAQLRHRGIAQVYDLHESGRTFYLVMEYIDGLSLRAIQRHAAQHGRPLSEALSCFIAAEAAEALHCAHSAVDGRGKPLRIVHRDVSPQNIMVSRRGEVKLLDFGVALSAAAGREQTEPGHVKGKFAYMSPEQARGERTLDGRSDLFALGIILVELLTGSRVFEGRTEQETWLQIVQETEARVSRAVAELPEALQVILRALLARDVARRPRSGAELARALRTYLAGKGVLFDAADAAAELAALTGDARAPATDSGAGAKGQGLEASKPLSGQPAPPSRCRSRAMLGVLGALALLTSVGAVAAWRGGWGVSARLPAPSPGAPQIPPTQTPAPTQVPTPGTHAVERAGTGPVAPAGGRSLSAGVAPPRRRSLDSSTATTFADAPVMSLGRITLTVRLLSPADPEEPGAVTAEVATGIATAEVRIPQGAVLTCAVRGSGIPGRVGLACDTLMARGRAWGLEGIVVGEDLRPGLPVALVGPAGNARSGPAPRGTPFRLFVSNWSGGNPPGP